MSQHIEQRFVPYTAQQMFDLVAAVEDYPTFLPWCLAASVRDRTAGSLVADLTIGNKAFRDKFTSQVTLHAPKAIQVAYKGGPLSHLENEWRFTPEKGGCVIDFRIDFRIKSRLLSGVMDLFFDKAFKKMVEAFEKRAFKLYGSEK